MEELEIPELAYTSLFSMAWLDSINRERSGNGRVTLEHCLLSADNDIFRVPWEDVVHPEFISRPPKVNQLVLENGRDEVKEGQEDHASDSGHRILTGTSMVESAERRDLSTTVKLLRVLEQDSSGRSSAADDSEGEYVELADITLPRFSPQKGSLTQAISMNYRNLHKPRTTGPEQPKTNALVSSGKNGRCRPSMVCSMLIEENLTEPFLHQTPAGLHSERKMVNEYEPTSKGTAPSDCMPEHEPVTECVPEHLDCINTALCDLKTNNLLHIDHEPLIHCLAPEPESDQPTLSSYTTEKSAMDKQRIISKDEPDSNLSDSATRQDTSKPNELVTGSDSVETPKEAHTELGDGKKPQTEPKQEDPTDQPASWPAESENRTCGSPCSSESSLSSCDTEEGRPRSVSPQGQQVDWAIVSAQLAESQVSASLPGHERTEPCEKKESENRNKEYVDTMMEAQDQAEGEKVAEMQYVDESEAGTGGKELERGTANVRNTEGVAVNVAEKAMSPQTGLDNSTPKSGTTVSTPPGHEAGSSLGTEERKEMADRQKKKIEESEEGENMQIESNGTEDVEIMGCPVFDIEVTMGIKTESAVFQNPEVMSDVPVANDSTPSEQMNICTPDALAEAVNIPPVVEVEEEMNDRQEESIEEHRPQDEPVSSVNNTQLETGKESPHQQQEQKKGRVYFLITNLTCHSLSCHAAFFHYPALIFNSNFFKTPHPWDPLHTPFS